MLGKLVIKFKKHSLHEDAATTFGGATSVNSFVDHQHQQQSQQQQKPPYRRSARISALYRGGSVSMHDSGTESDDDELEQLDSLLNEKNAHSSDLLGSSPPNLTSSPPLISEFETNSWDSIGCESGIGLHDRSGDVSEASQDYILDDTLKDKKFSNSMTMFIPESGTNNDMSTVAVSCRCTDNSGKTGAFRPVTRRRSNQDLAMTFGAPGAIGEKRRYENIAPKVCADDEHHDCGSETPPLSPIATRLRSNNVRQQSLCVTGGSPTDANHLCTEWTMRETLVAARRQPIKLLIHNACAVRRRTSNECTTPNDVRLVHTTNVTQQLPPPPPQEELLVHAPTHSYHHPYKRGRMTNSGRPSLDFEKMRQRMVLNNVCGVGSQEFVDSAMGDNDKDIEKRKHDWALSGNPGLTSAGRRCLIHQQTRCQQADCTYRAIDTEPSSTGAGEHHLGGADDQ